MTVASEQLCVHACVCVCVRGGGMSLKHSRVKDFMQPNTNGKIIPYMYIT